MTYTKLISVKWHFLDPIYRVTIYKLAPWVTVQ